MLDKLLDLEAIKGRCEKATEGPWEWEAEDEGDVFLLGTKDLQVFEGHVLTVEKCESCKQSPSHCSLPVKVDMDFLAHARTDIPALIAEVEGLRRQVEYQEQLQRR